MTADHNLSPTKKGLIFDIKKYAIHDGPGIRTTIFLKGCPLSCWWCQNPESLNPLPQIMVHGERCIGCEACAEVCPEGIITLSRSGMTTDEKRCVHCGFCAEACPARAREMIGRLVDVEDIVREIEKDVPFYDESGGGVTLSGGEPLAQPRFVLNVLDALGKLDIHRTVDTTGYADPQLLLKVAAKTELFLYDLKHMDSKRHRHYVGVPNDLILSNLRLISEYGSDITVRIPIIPGFNDGDENIQCAGSFISSLPGVNRVAILPYHDAARNKYRKLNLAYRLGKIIPPSETAIGKVLKTLETFGLALTLGG